MNGRRAAATNQGHTRVSGNTLATERETSSYIEADKAAHTEQHAFSQSQRKKGRTLKRNCCEGGVDHRTTLETSFRPDSGNKTQKGRTPQRSWLQKGACTTDQETYKHAYTQAVTRHERREARARRDAANRQRPTRSAHLVNRCHSSRSISRPVVLRTACRLQRAL